MISVAIYEDNEGLRDILAQIIEGNEEFQLVGAYNQCTNVVEQTQKTNPDVILMDIDMPGISGIEGIQLLKKNNIKTEIIVNTVFDDDDRVFDAIKAGATGYLLKNSSLSHILEAVRDVYNGGAPMSSSIARKVLSMTSSRSSSNDKTSLLNERELAVITKLSKGLSYKMVAEEMSMSIDTVRGYIKRIYEKLQVHSITEAVHKVFIDK